MDLYNPFGLPHLTSDEIGRLREHITQLASEGGLEWREQDIAFLEAEGDIGEGWFISSTIRNEFDYLVGLHEVGHHLLSLRTFQEDGSTVAFENEVGVWRWVRENAIVEVSAEAWDACRACLDTYPEQRPPEECVAEMRRLSPPPRGGDSRH